MTTPATALRSLFTPISSSADLAAGIPGVARMAPTVTLRRQVSCCHGAGVTMGAGRIAMLAGRDVPAGLGLVSRLRDGAIRMGGGAVRRGGAGRA